MENVRKFKAIQKITGLIFLLALMAFSLVTCAGPTGPEGPAGADGKEGPAGSAGAGIVWKGELASAPVSPVSNWVYFNTTDGNAYIYTGTVWELLARQGAGIDWRGASNTPPANPELNWAYYNSADKKSYIFDGTVWQILAESGGTGQQGSAPYIGDNCNWWVGGNDTGVLAGHKSFDGVICRACGNIEGIVPIKGGTFSMGQDDISGATPVRSVTVSGFKMSRYQVTQELYFTVTGNNPSNFDGTTGKEPAVNEIQGRRPVEMETWYEAVEFCNKLSERGGLTPVYAIEGTTVSADWSANGYRLPTEAEWEYACRAGSTTIWHFGDTEGADESGLRGYAWYSVNAGSKTHQVGLKLPNDFGLYDMHGNVWEWCWDRYSTTYYGESGNKDNPKGPDDVTIANRVIRGGGWNNSADYHRSANRSGGVPDSRYDRFGFRLVRR